MSGCRSAIGQDAQDGEQARLALDLIDHDQPLQESQGGERLFQAGQRDRVFQVEVVERIGGDELARQCYIPANV